MRNGRSGRGRRGLPFVRLRWVRRIRPMIATQSGDMAPPERTFMDRSSNRVQLGRQTYPATGLMFWFS